MIKRLFASLIILCASAAAQVPVTPIVNPRVTFVNGAGSACYGCSLYSYASGTTMPLATFTDSTGTSQNTNPIILGADGGATIWLGTNAYKFILVDSTGATVWSVDNVTTLGSLPVPISHGGTGQTTGIAALNALGSANGTTPIAFGNPFTAPSVNNVVWAAPPSSGGDWGTQINLAFTAMGSYCGTVMIPYVNTSFAVQIVKPRCIQLEGNGSQLTWTGTSATTPAIVTGSVTNPNYARGGIRNLTLISGGTAAGTQPGIFIGGIFASYNVPGGAVTDFLETYEDVTVSGFLDNWVKGNNVEQDTWLGGASTYSMHSGFLDESGFGSENMNFFGSMFLNGAGWGFYSNNLAGSEYNFTQCSFDYQQLGEIYFGNGSIHIVGGHIEGLVAPFINGPASSTAGFSSYLVMSGGPVVVYLGSTALTAPIVIQGINSSAYIDDGLYIYHPESSVSELVDWLAVGASNQLNVGAYFDPTAPGGVTIPAVQSGANLAWEDIPKFTQYTPTSRYMTTLGLGTLNSINVAGGNGYFGTVGNLNGTIPSPSTFPGNGAFTSWNGENAGEVDYLDSFNTTAIGIDAYAWFGNISGTLTKLAALQENGEFVPNLYGTGSNCNSTASTAACGTAASGVVAIPVGATSVTVNTGAATANSRIMLTISTYGSLPTNLSSLGAPVLTAEAAGSFAISTTSGLAPATQYLKVQYWIVN